MTHFQVTGNPCVKFQLLIIIHYKIYGLDMNYAIFWSDLQLAQTTLGQDHDTPSGHMQSFYGVGTSLVFP